MTGDHHIFKQASALRRWCEEIIETWEWKRGIAVKSELNTGTRTLAQNAAMHMHFDNIAKKLNELGIDQKVVWEHREKSILTGWTGDSFKETVYKPMMLAMTKKHSTTQLNKMEVSDIDYQLNMWFAEHFPEFDYPEFPNKEMLNEEV